ESRSGAPEGERAPQAEALRKQRFLRRASAPNADKRRALRTRVCATDIGWMRLLALRSPRLSSRERLSFWTGLVAAKLGRLRAARTISLVIASVSEAIQL